MVLRQPYYLLLIQSPRRVRRHAVHGVQLLSPVMEEETCSESSLINFAFVYSSLDVPIRVTGDGQSVSAAMIGGIAAAGILALGAVLTCVVVLYRKPRDNRPTDPPHQPRSPVEHPPKGVPQVHVGESVPHAETVSGGRRL